MDSKIKIGIIGATIIIVGGVIGYNFIGKDKGSELNKSNVKSQVESESGKEVTYSDTYQNMLNKYYDEIKAGKKFSSESYDAYDLVHWMSNSVIEAKEGKKIGFIEPSPENIEKLITILKSSSVSHKDFFIETLGKWKKGDFDKVKDMHNTAWKMLDGNIGKATGPDENEINKLKEKYYK
ncbi:MAG: DUF6241 domain-containing protein [Paraclostridium sp.]|uniref:DUF6241 domain-containing protein n=1 Tax=Paraclostridium sp. TaxID=2023273 RepID=UPI003F34A37B